MKTGIRTAIRVSLAGILAVTAAHSQIPARIKWACLGNSLTAGYPQANLTYVSGATRLAGLIGPQDSLRNFGVSSSTLLKKGDVPYWTRTISGTPILASIFAFKPDIISIELGTNDTKAANWQYNADFVADLTALVDTLSNNISPKPDIWLMLPPPIYSNTFGINDSIMTNGVIPKIRQVATAKGLKILDANTRMRVIATTSPTTYYVDGVHFTPRGSDSLSAVLYRSFFSQVVRVACVGSSTTEGYGLSTPLAQAYPPRLNMLLGRNYYVRNEGLSGTYMQKQGAVPYWTSAKFPDVFLFKPNVITIFLGGNDSRTTQWNTARYKTDYRAMIDTFSNAISPKPQIWMCKPTPTWMVNGAWPFDDGIAGNGLNGNTIRDSVGPAVQQVATERGLPVIDLYTPMLPWQSYASDGAHTNAAGHDTLAHVIYRALLAGTTGITAPKIRLGSNLQAIVRGGNLYVTLPGTLSGRLEIRTVAGTLLGSKAVAGGVSVHSLTGLPQGTYVAAVRTSAGGTAKLFVLGAGEAGRK